MARPPQPQAPGTRHRRAAPLVALTLAPIVLLLAAEGALRLSHLDQAHFRNLPLPGESEGLLIQDPDLFWANRPNFAGMSQGAFVTINAQGLRGTPIPPRQPGEFRILCLGESTTFGAMVDNEATYAARLEADLLARFPAHTWRVINAGVSAYSSFQSLLYLERRGLALQPDLILLYHELNDYLPSAVRSAEGTEIGLCRTDPQLYASRQHRLHRACMRHSAIYRAATYAWARHQVRRLPPLTAATAWPGIGMDHVDRLPPIAFEEQRADRPSPQPHPAVLARRLSEAERLDTLTRLLAVTRRAGARLVILHPSYALSRPHTCVLTRFCERQAVPMLETVEVLHPTNAIPLFADSWHPTAEGHARLANAILDFLVAQRLLPE